MWFIVNGPLKLLPRMLKFGGFSMKGIIKMEIKNITTSDLRRMNGKEGLILQGCGGETQEWVDGINKMLKEKGILLDDTKFENVSVFQNDGVTCILYPFDDVHLDIGKLAMWRLQSYTAFAGTWLSDYVENKLGGFEAEQVDSINEDIDERQAMGYDLS